MATLQTYNPPTDRIVHTTQVDFLSRSGFEQPVYLVQGDQSLPIIAVELYKNGTRYAVPEDASGNVRWKKPNPSNEFAYNPLLGVSEDRMTAYFEVTQQMAIIFGEPHVIIEILVGKDVAGSSKIPVFIDKNPVQQGDIESTDETTTLYDLVEQASASASAAKDSQTAAKLSEDNAASSAQKAADSAEAADNSEQLAKEHMEAAAVSETNAAASEVAAQTSAENASASETSAAGSADESAQSATESEDWSNVSKSWAVGEGMGDQRPDEATDNSKWYAQQAKDSADSAAASVQVLEDNKEAIQNINDNLTDIQNVSENMTDVQAVSENMSDVTSVSSNMSDVQSVIENMEAIQGAPDAADRAEAAADSAQFDADRAEEAANRAQSIAQGAKGYYETPESLRESIPEGTTGDWAIVGSTDTIWVWDGETGDWKNTHQATDLSNYYTKDQADEENNKLLAQVTQETNEKLANKLGKTEKAVSATNVETISDGPNLTVKEDTNNVYLQVSNISDSDTLDKFDIVVDKKDGYAWIHEYKNNADASGDLGNHKIYTSAFPQPSVTGNAGTATKLATPRSLKTNLAFTAKATFDGSSDQNGIPVTGILGIANGGTGNTTGNAPTATKLNPGATINGVLFNGSQPISIKPKISLLTTSTVPYGDKNTTAHILNANLSTVDAISVTFGIRFTDGGTICKSPTIYYKNSVNNGAWYLDGYCDAGHFIDLWLGFPNFTGNVIYFSYVSTGGWSSPWVNIYGITY